MGPSDLRHGLLFAAGATSGVVCTCIYLYLSQRHARPDKQHIVDGVPGLIGNTPLVRIQSLSEATGCEILGKAEFLNPGGSVGELVKDRVSLHIIEKAEKDGHLVPHTNSCIFEGTVGSTGISIATVARAKGYLASIILPDDVAQEKAQTLEKLGAHVQKVRPQSIVSKAHFVNLAKSMALEYGRETDAAINGDELVVKASAPQQRGPRGLFADQFENLANLEAHYQGTAPEIWEQTGGQIDAFVAGAGTGGTLAGCARFLKQKRRGIQIALADPQGSGLFNRIKYGVVFSPEEAEGTRRRHQSDTVVEGVGLTRLTANFAEAIPHLDDAFKVSDAEAVAMSRYLVLNDGLFLGSSSAVNLVAAVRLSKKLPKGSRIVTILCDSGSRHHSRFWNDDALLARGIPVSSDIASILS